MTAEHLFAENKEKQINAALMALITKDMPPDDLQGMEQQFHALRRLVASKAGFAFVMHETVVPYLGDHLVAYIL